MEVKQYNVPDNVPAEIIEKLKSGALDNPGELADHLVVLSAYISSLGEREVEASIAYAQKWQSLRTFAKTDKDCDMKAMLTEEYRVMKNAQWNNKTIQSCIQSLKKKLANLEFEWRSGQN